MFSGIFSRLVRGGFREVIAFALGLALLGALWNASLWRLSSQESAVGILTQVGVQVVNPVFVQGHLGGMSQTELLALTKDCHGATGSAGLPVLGFTSRVRVHCSALDSADPLASATRDLYASVAEQYYANGISGVFPDVTKVPPVIVDLLTGQSVLPQVSSVPVPSGSVAVPHLPSNPLLQLGAGVGFSFSTLTAAGHAKAQTNTMWFGGAALLLLLLLALTSKGGKRLTAMGHALIGSAIPGVAVLGLVVFLMNRYAQQAQHFQQLLDYILKAFVPVYAGAAAAGILLYAGAFVWRLVVKPAATGVKDAVPAMVGAAARPRGGEAGLGDRGGYGAGGYAAGGYGSPRQPQPRVPQPQPGYGDRRPAYGQPQSPYGQPPYGQPQTPYPPAATEQYPWRTPETGPRAPQPQGPLVGPGGPQPQPPSAQTWQQPMRRGQQRPAVEEPTQDLPASLGGNPSTRPAPYGGSQGQVSQPANPPSPPYARPSPRLPQQSGWGSDDDWPPRR